jgi:hypothetical protein
VSLFIRRCGAEGRIVAFQAIDCGRNFRREGGSLPLHSSTGQMSRQRVAASSSYPAKLRIVWHHDGEELCELKRGVESETVSAETRMRALQIAAAG